ncbi:AraC family transcriptional regulator [Shewanella sp. MF05960]|uniref:AraC family transcriptional regulator n=1 Tax=Shewanella sp. MF05960 TaxID=3434874 RepID=UPI003D7921B6
MSHRLDKAFEQALAYVDKHMHVPVNISVLAEISGIAESHFRHLFHALYRLSIEQYVDLLKSLQAAHQLGFGEQIPLATIATSLGYIDETHFVQSFTDSIGQSPQSFQHAPDWGNFFSKQQPLKSFQAPSENDFHYSVTEIALDPLVLAIMNHTGHFSDIPVTVQRFIQWRQCNALGHNVGHTYYLLYSHPQDNPYHMGIGVSLDSDNFVRLASSGLTDPDIQTKVIPAGRYAMMLVSSDTAGNNINSLLHDGVSYLYRQWLNTHNVELRDSPLMFERLDVAAADGQVQHVKIYLPIQ